jgi:hypothetical protein
MSAITEKGFTMQTLELRNAFDVVTDFLVSNPTPEEILAYRLPEDLQARAHDLLERNGEDMLSMEEQQELGNLMRADEMISLLKAKTLLKLRKTAE